MTPFIYPLRSQVKLWMQVWPGLRQTGVRWEVAIIFAEMNARFSTSPLGRFQRDQYMLPNAACTNNETIPKITVAIGAGMQMLPLPPLTATLIDHQRRQQQHQPERKILKPLPKQQAYIPRNEAQTEVDESSSPVLLQQQHKELYQYQTT